MRMIGLVSITMLIILPRSFSQELLQRSQSFDSDPSWDGFRNRLTPDKPKITRQDFGWRDSNYARGKNHGEIGGWIERSITPASYTVPITPVTLKDRLTANGRFAVTRDNGNSGMMFGFLNKASRGWRTQNSLVFRIDGNGGKYWVFFEYGTQHWLCGGMGCFEGERYQTTSTRPFPADGNSHEWSLVYDPAASDGAGAITFTLDGHPYTMPLANGHKDDGATFDRFGMMNVQVAGSGMEIYFDDLEVQGQPVELSADPKWDAAGNHGEFKDLMERPFHQFGFSATNHAGGSTGELGGVIWRNEEPAYYAEKIGTLTLNDELHASGRLAFTGAGSDSGAFIGFFNAESKRGKMKPMHEEPEHNILAMYLEGPSRIGHYFRPAYFTRSGKGQITESGPVLRPNGEIHRWSFDYSPNGAEGLGRISIKIDDMERTYDLRPGEKTDGASFDRFGIFNAQSGGHYVEVWFDDLVYTASRP